MRCQGVLRLLAMVFVVPLAACAGPAPSAGDSETARDAGSDPTTVQITLSEMKIESSLTTFEHGKPYRFVVTNHGQIPHEMMIVPPLITQMQGQMPMQEMMMEQLDEMALYAVHADDLPPGGSQSFDYTFSEAASEGELELACYVSGHYEAGMKLPIAVR